MNVYFNSEANNSSPNNKFALHVVGDHDPELIKKEFSAIERGTSDEIIFNEIKETVLHGTSIHQIEYLKILVSTGSCFDCPSERKESGCQGSCKDSYFRTCYDKANQLR